MKSYKAEARGDSTDPLARSLFWQMSLIRLATLQDSGTFLQQQVKPRVELLPGVKL
jgi:hypothetical protein